MKATISALGALAIILAVVGALALARPSSPLPTPVGAAATHAPTASPTAKVTATPSPSPTPTATPSDSGTPTLAQPFGSSGGWSAPVSVTTGWWVCLEHATAEIAVYDASSQLIDNNLDPPPTLADANSVSGCWAPAVPAGRWVVRVIKPSGPGGLRVYAPGAPAWTQPPYPPSP